MSKTARNSAKVCLYVSATAAAFDWRRARLRISTLPRIACALLLSVLSQSWTTAAKRVFEAVFFVAADSRADKAVEILPVVSSAASCLTELAVQILKTAWS